MFLADIVSPNSFVSGLAIPHRECALSMHDMIIFYVTTILQANIVFIKDHALIEDNLFVNKNYSCFVTVCPGIYSYEN